MILPGMRGLGHAWLFENNYSLDLDSIDDHFSALSFSTSGYTALSVEVWAKADAFGSYNVLAGQWRSNNTANSSWLLESVGSVVRFYVDKNGTGTADYAGGNTTITTGSWYQYIATWDGSTVTLYVNGTAESTTLAATGIGTPTTGLVCGALFNSSGTAVSNGYWDGHLGGVQIWDSALTSSEVTELYNSGTPIDPRFDTGNYTSSADLVAFYPIEEGTGTIIADRKGNNVGSTPVSPNWSSDTP